MPGYDLIDEENKKIVQISYDFNINKVKTILDKIKLKCYDIIFPTNDNLEKIKQHKNYNQINYELKFDSLKNIKNLNDLYREMEYLDFDIAKELYDFVSENLVILINPLTIQNNSKDLLKIINLLNFKKLGKIENEHDGFMISNNSNIYFSLWCNYADTFEREVYGLMSVTLSASWPNFSTNKTVDLFYSVTERTS